MAWPTKNDRPNADWPFLAKVQQIRDLEKRQKRIAERKAKGAKTNRRDPWDEDKRERIEAAIVRLKKEGLGYKIIAKRLGIVPSTARKHWLAWVASQEKASENPPEYPATKPGSSTQDDSDLGETMGSECRRESA